ncbi:hypothetical protein TVAG_460700 [Trichomonas vaginalis G3]|uniref:Ubiquitin-like domain-containing protein n=1 Tax=Trichomonas vaginalis (strain ATCC PRA-98 / G3) TaxID=412133 RepID=A2DY44_TRIV3|nr:ubiquitin-like family [Trichomonas vaginalis G3]EAY14653.1 hypothetical protein TVAG_460700 [Trichomonas vaginalis G3]KAI5505403.1 ubiquitin-like family [Trichomonas vaginalis G3]|eukprot:XP_001326876.1 hypothetical protein [Trichomonas vaginalis G3]
MQVWIHTCDNKIYRHTFSHNDSVQSVQDIANMTCQSLILYNNTILVPSMPLGYYKISNGSHIYIVPQWTQKVVPKPVKFSPAQVDDIKREAERIKDMMYSKIDSTPKYFSKIVKRFNGIKREENLNVEQQTLSIPSKLVSPSSTALPKFW